MGGWGVYDDENDNVADIWIEIEENTMPKNFEEIEKYVKNEFEALNIIRRAYAKNNQQKLFDSIKKWLTKFKQNMKGYEDPYINISGVALKAARVIQDLPSSDPLGSGIFDSGIPKTLPPGYPEWLRQEALKAVKIQLDEIDENKSGWRNIDERKKALQNELFYFSKGSRIKKSIKKSRNSRKSGNSRRSRGSRRSNGSRKKSRQGPNISATSVKIGTIKKGNDDNLWKVKAFDTKFGQVQRWVRNKN